jgi:hypothetical protein
MIDESPKSQNCSLNSRRLFVPRTLARNSRRFAPFQPELEENLMKKTLLAAVLSLATLAPLAPVVQAETYAEERRERFTARVDTVFKRDPYLSVTTRSTPIPRAMRPVTSSSKAASQLRICASALSIWRGARRGLCIVNRIRVGKGRY